MQNKCINCGKPATELHHVVPLALGGNDIDSNKVNLCSSCHALIHGFNVQKRGVEWHELQKAGIERAKTEGKYKGRKPIDIDRKKFNKACEEWRNGERTATSIMREFHITSPTFYRRVREWRL